MLRYTIKVMLSWSNRGDPQIHLGSRVDAVDNKRPAHGRWLAWRGRDGHLGQSGAKVAINWILRPGTALLK